MATKRAKPVTGSPRVGDDAVRARTGRAWAGWVAALDAAGARELPHRDIARLLRERFDVGRWWNQMVAVGYEQLIGPSVRPGDRGRLHGHRQPDRGGRPTTTVRGRDGRQPRGCRAASIVHRSTPPKSLRATAPGGRKSISVNLYAKGPGKTQVTAEQLGLATQAEALRVKRQWAASLGKLAAACQSPRAETRKASQARSARRRAENERRQRRVRREVAHPLHAGGADQLLQEADQARGHARVPRREARPRSR